MGSLKKGAEQAVNVCMKVRKAEKVVVITDRKTMVVGKAIYNAAKKVTPRTELYNLDKYGRRPLKKLPDNIRKTLKDTDVSFLAIDVAADKNSNERFTVRRPVRKIVLCHHGRHAGMPGVTKKMLETGLSADYKKIQRISNKVYNKVRNAKKIVVKNEMGTDLTATFSRKLKWLVCDGCIRPSHWSNLPDGEVFTSPENVNGKAVVVLMGDVYRKPLKKPITYHIRNSRIEKIECSNKKLKAALWRYFKKYNNSDRVGEFAIGTNTGVQKFVGSMLQDEKHPGVHIAFGSPYPAETGAKWDCKSHNDQVMVKTDIFVDEKQIMKKGKFIL
jgi:leucyl aminopeptidase (aminopeptidase T)